VSKRNNRKYGLSRRLGVNLWGRAKDPVNSRNFPPGQHGTTGFKKKTDFGTQLAAKQKLRGYYGDVTEKQFRNIYREAARRKGDTGEHLIGLLESRLDAMVYRAGFVPTIFAARQFVNHGHVLVDGKRVNIPSYRLKPGQVVQIREKSRQLTIVMEAMQSKERSVPEYIEVNEADLSVKYLRMPILSDVPYPVVMEPHLVVEYYSTRA
jgi:small subunit ribosomal protein S4